MMYSKALLFQDLEIAKKILEEKTAREQKNLGRAIRGFEENQWMLFREGIVFTSNLAKFSQNKHLKEALLNTNKTTLVEASPKDCLWGIGLRASDPRAQDPKQWRGLNLLGKTLTRVREVIKLESGLA